MKEHIWTPVDADEDGSTTQITYRNELGEEFVYATDHCQSHTICWPKCIGDWPGCRAGCQAFNSLQNKWNDQMKKARVMPEYDQFSFILHHKCFIDDNNLYVEQFETLDGVQWEIAVDIEKQLLDMLDRETQDEGDVVESL